MNRRDMLKMTGAAVAGTSLFGLDAVASERNYREEVINGEKKARKAGKRISILRNTGCSRFFLAGETERFMDGRLD